MQVWGGSNKGIPKLGFPWVGPSRSLYGGFQGWNVKRFLAHGRALDCETGGVGIRACLPYPAYKARASQLYVLIMLVV